jgi:hypothetical protein
MSEKKIRIIAPVMRYKKIRIKKPRIIGDLEKTECFTLVYFQELYIKD